MTDTPVRPVRVIVQDSGNASYTNRLLVGTACTGNVRIEWMQARYGQAIPINWSMTTFLQTMGGYYPLRYQVADAQNLIVQEAVRQDYEWLLLHEHDVVLPLDAFVRFNRYMLAGTHPVVSGLYFSRSYPSDPMVFKMIGDSYATDWRIGDVVPVAAVPTGCVLIHMALIRAMYADSAEYTLNDITVRRVFNTPREVWVNPETGAYNCNTMTSDLDWCKRVIDGDYLRKAGWTTLADQAQPFLCDTGITCGHIEPDGRVYPDKKRLAEWR
ncbi:MAG: hypothetical protein WBC13_14145 [Dokdonella sp.]